MIFIKTGILLIGKVLIVSTFIFPNGSIKDRQSVNCVSCIGQSMRNQSYNQEKHMMQKVNSETMEEITPKELKELKDKEENIIVLDVREPYETQKGTIADAITIPLGNILAEKAQLDATKTIVVVCRTGNRSARAIQTLKLSGYTGRLINLRGGMNGWSQDIDPSLPVY